MRPDLQRLKRDTETGRVAASSGTVAVAQAPSGRQGKLWKVVVPLLTVVLLVAGRDHYCSHQSEPVGRKHNLRRHAYRRQTGAAGFESQQINPPDVSPRAKPPLQHPPHLDA